MKTKNEVQAKQTAARKKATDLINAWNSAHSDQSVDLNYRDDS